MPEREKAVKNYPEYPDDSDGFIKDVADSVGEDDYRRAKDVHDAVNVLEQYMISSPELVVAFLANAHTRRFLMPKHRKRIYDD